MKSPKNLTQKKCKSAQLSIRGVLLCSKHNSTTSFLYLFLRELRKELRLHNKWSWRSITLAKNFEIAELSYINECSFTVWDSFCRLRQKRIQAVHIDNRTVELVHCLVEIPHTDFSKVTRMVLVEKNTMMMQASCITATSRVLSVLTYASMASTYMAPLFPVLLEPGRHLRSADPVDQKLLHDRETYNLSTTLLSNAFRSHVG
ncbi:hypothetical protein KP509_18G051800 [Ceratopteris richardii]|uniref:Uncharacterized protein n=1 Tax=Ceratopteris richardii TaxID=49495 RepID=A0A8T2SRS1_CERRI|nr:hypothetical protein KP509_18G051800 [Ceratopteris richardii]